ncbi:hypothetical protein IJJ12_01290 [bacterium]|nr:hypothetical protein [bacterium]
MKTTLTLRLTPTQISKLAMAAVAALVAIVFIFLLWRRPLTPENKTALSPTPSASPAASDHVSLYSEREQTLVTDTATGWTYVSTLVPEGWTVDGELNWDQIDVTYPLLAHVTLTSPDERMRVHLWSPRQFIDDQSGGADGPDRQQYLTYRTYRPAEVAADETLADLGFGSWQRVGELTPAAAWSQAVSEATAEIMDETVAALADQQVSVRQQMAYQSAAAADYGRGENLARVMTTVTGAEYQLSLPGGSTMTTATWEQPWTAVLVAADRDSFEQYLPVAEAIVRASYWTNDFFAAAEGVSRQITQALAAGQLDQLALETKARDSYQASEWVVAASKRSRRLMSSYQVL